MTQFLVLVKILRPMYNGIIRRFLILDQKCNNNRYIKTQYGATIVTLKGNKKD